MTKQTQKLVLLLVLALLFADTAHGRELGINIQAKQSDFFLDPTLERVFVGGVVKGSAAERAGIRAKDELLQIDAIVIPKSKASVLKRYWGAVKPSQRVVLLVLRDGRRFEIVIPPETPGAD